MATFFGEVLSVYSRAVEEDDDDDLTQNEEDEQIRREIEEKRSVRVQWMSQTDTRSVSCSHLIIAVGLNATGFTSAYVLSCGGWSAVGWVSLWNERSHSSSRTDSAPVPGQPACVLYQQEHNPSVMMCVCTCYVAEDQLFQWAEKVLGCVQKRALTVTVLSDCVLAEYKASDYLSGNSTPFLRALKTATYTGAVACPLLEQPNIITGLSAAVLSHCQVHQIPAVVYQCYSDVTHPDSVTMETYKAALTGLSAAVKMNRCPTSEILQKFTRVSEVQSNLYT
ncbi:proteasome assembly chaperone 1 [Triplophysa rosa]|uniref:Proteasome assembly chaperone 1 n=1 Tax=Triplophysa rosa TaxID=992332 RepID=A0A9W7WCY1_TRIRA|nr:proteasome assembly chaperone 1 [Triplophysa rosa]KAI7793353.1 putative proteasome assembly chaperone 1 [Triplophysa rosa]